MIYKYIFLNASIVLLIIFSYSISAEDNASEIDCDALYEKLHKEAGGDITKCSKPEVAYDLNTCQAPKQYDHTRIPAQVILALDASGSMAGKTGSETKMQAAKRETLAFMNALETDVPVGLIAYGHKGNNTEAGKEVSCVGIEWVQELGADTADTQEAINQFKPTGWTPLGATLEFLNSELREKYSLPKSETESENDSETGAKKVPVVYLISDGEETCEGDPVEQARLLHESGVSAIINVVGFDVDDKTRAQLEKISEAGGGRYIVANDARELRKELEAESRTRQEISQYNTCVDKNMSLVLGAYTKAIRNTQICFYDEGYRNSMDPITNTMQKYSAEDAPEAVCYSEVADKAGAYYETATEIEEQINEQLRQERKLKVEEVNQYISK